MIDRSDIKACVARFRIKERDVDGVVDRLIEISLAYQRRTVERLQSPLISDVLRELSVLEHEAKCAIAGKPINLPQIMPETVAALAGLYPFSACDLAPVAWNGVHDQPLALAPPRTAVTGATVEPHVLNAAMQQNLGTPHLLAVRMSPFPYAAAKDYFYGRSSDSRPSAGQRIESFIAGGPEVAFRFIQVVHQRVRLATCDPNRQNPGQRSLDQWAEPSPDGRLVFDVLETVLEPRFERPPLSIRKALIELIEILRVSNSDSGGTENLTWIREQIVSGVVTNWIALHAHQSVTQRLADVLNRARHDLRSRRGRLVERMTAYRAVIEDSLTEYARRAEMGDISSNSVRTARATGEPATIVELADAARATSDFLLVRRVARACRAASNNPQPK
jgi:hypothetical protein